MGVEHYTTIDVALMGQRSDQYWSDWPMAKHIEVLHFAKCCHETFALVMIEFAPPLYGELVPH